MVEAGEWTTRAVVVTRGSSQRLVLVWRPADGGGLTQRSMDLSRGASFAVALWRTGRGWPDLRWECRSPRDCEIKMKQLGFKLRTWGGKRKGAGRPPTSVRA
jgi:hypothetical protein